MIKTLRFSLLATLLVVTAYYAILHFKVLQIGHPITQDEPGFVEIVAANDSYSHDGVLNSGNVYGPGYPVWARPFTAIFSNPYIALRVASSVALFALLGVLAWVLRGEGLGWIETGAALAIVYILNASSHSLAACPDLLGAALYFAALAVSKRGTWPALLAGIALTAAAALTKPYFAFAGVIVGSQLLLFGPPRKALAYIGLSAVLAAATLALLHALAPFYFLSAFLYHRTVAARSFHTLLSQSGEFALLTAGVLVLALLARPRRRTLAFSWTRPFLSPAVDLWSWSVVLATIVLLGALGWHPGNRLVYYFHLLLAPLVVVALGRVPQWPRAGRLLLCVNLLILGWLTPPIPSNDNWAALASSVTSSRGPILADPFLEPFARERSDVELLTHGESASIRNALDQLGAAAPAAYTGLQREFTQRAQLQASRIRAKAYAAIYLCYVDVGGGAAWNYDESHILPAVFASYRLADEVVVYPYATPYWDRMRHGLNAQHVTRWVPKSIPGANLAGQPNAH